jgi:hypothetical protein
MSPTFLTLLRPSWLSSKDLSRGSFSSAPAEVVSRCSTLSSDVCFYPPLKLPTVVSDDNIIKASSTNARGSASVVGQVCQRGSLCRGNRRERLKTVRYYSVDTTSGEGSFSLRRLRYSIPFHIFTLFVRNPNYISMMNLNSRSRLLLRAKRPTARPSSSKTSFAEQETMIRQPSTQLSTAIGKLPCKSTILTSLPLRSKAAIFTLTQISVKPTSHDHRKTRVSFGLVVAYKTNNRQGRFIFRPQEYLRVTGAVYAFRVSVIPQQYFE